MNPDPLTLTQARVRPASIGKRRTASAPAAPGASDTEVHRFKRCLKDARTGLIESQYQVGLMLAACIGTKKNTPDALAWMTRAGERGHAGAQYMLGCHFAPEPGTAPRGQLDEARAMDWFYLASRQGHARAHHRLAQLLRQAHGTLSAQHEAAAAGSGLPDAQLELARQQLRAGGEEDLRSSGMAWLRRAAQSGLPAAQAELGLHYLNGAETQGRPPKACNGCRPPLSKAGHQPAWNCTSASWLSPNCHSPWQTPSSRRPATPWDCLLNKGLPGCLAARNKPTTGMNWQPHKTGHLRTPHWVTWQRRTTPKPPYRITAPAHWRATQPLNWCWPND